MLCLGRKTNQRIYIGEDISILILEVRKDGVVRLGISAPKDVRIMRDDAINKEQKESN